MENLLTTYEFQLWTDDFIIPNNINLNNNLFDSPLFLIEFRIQEFLRYLPEGGDSIVEEPRGPFTVRSFFLPSNAVIGDADDDNSICETLSYFGVPLHRMPTVIGGISSFARSMVAQTVNFGRPLLPIVVAIEVNTCNPRDLETAHRRKYGFIPEIEEEDKPMDKRPRID
ncbi:hypothetical protein EJD97_021626 [Solanum chilense]|uniref:Uncharacterized protein n=1 Tax=Solanum chilense TaxID=4083 RepID=A0A6N2AXC6_SOLCI|nr:hypothetical protein EJD97_021626 [Solanum chilense]